MVSRFGSLPSRYRVAILFGLGLLLLATPAMVGWFDLADLDRYRYEAERVQFTDDGWAVDGHVAVIDGDAACLERFPDRACMLERAIHENGGLEYDGPPSQALGSRYRYVYGEGQFYRTVANETANGSVLYDLRPAPTDEALAAISTERWRASSTVKRAIRTGSVTSADELDGANELVEMEDGYYVVYAASSHEVAGERNPWIVGASWIAAAIGLGTLLRAQRLRVERQW